MLRLFLIALVIVALVLWVLTWQGRQYKDFAKTAKRTTATVVRKDERLPRPDQPTRKEHWLIYSYQVGNTVYEGQEKMEFEDLWQSAAVGQEIEVYYSGAKPQVSHPVVVMDRRSETVGKFAE